MMVMMMVTATNTGGLVPSLTSALSHSQPVGYLLSPLYRWRNQALEPRWLIQSSTAGKLRDPGLKPKWTDYYVKPQCYMAILSSSHWGRPCELQNPGLKIFPCIKGNATVERLGAHLWKFRGGKIREKLK